MTGKPDDIRLRRGWTTGACAAAAARAAFCALRDRAFPDPVTIRLPRGQTPSFKLTEQEIGDGFAAAAVIKDAGDDPDITHGATVRARVAALPAGSGLVFQAGEGVGMVTKPGLPIPPGEPAINPKPREIIEANLRDVLDAPGAPLDLAVEISVPGGAALAEKTWNPRLGIVGGLSILGTTGIVIPYSCSAWIHSIHRGIDVARATGLTHVAGATGKTSEVAVRRLYDLPLEAMLDMGDFAGGLLKYLRRHPVDRLTIAGGFAKLGKLAQGHLDLHSSRSQLDLEKLADLAASLGGDDSLHAAVAGSNTGAEALSHCSAAGIPIAQAVARQAREVALAACPGVDIDILIVDRDGTILAGGG
ncbi:cobalt-precorrin-5B (C(1))-methyltransferase [Rhodospirillaceae bacterium KN72]|uniref:Cobalt-precorrin-5B C(1)-methyltransferase n=1 Tax=Pacificispira spongiicola TaxID=2729598 RepID=A0A7Y0E0M3_9PROT|nr:cobalt-precorrin-5B (C(1))-methyltransferase [Pacificispira spongiicola]NMM45064.1 cobalt-precorrin-5B (C(1))-methyltransferase [Pacificispira spongiicola]